MRDWLEARWYAQAPPPAWLRPLAALYGAIAERRRQRLTRSAVKVSVPVIVVGNIVVGGTGKTPFVIWLIEQLRADGWNPGVISRGYGGRAPAYPYSVGADGDPALTGDEPLLIARRAQCPVMVAPDRVAAARQLIEASGVDIIVSDDGLQHYRLARDLEICIVDGVRGVGNGALMPVGPLRESPRRLREVDWVVTNGAPLAALPVAALTMRLHAVDALPLDGGPSRDLATFAGQRVHAVAGIGRPARFFETLRRAGIEVLEHPFPDHHAYRAEDLAFGDGLPVLMTEKDAVKCRGFRVPQGWVVPVSAVLSSLDTQRVQESTARLRGEVSRASSDEGKRDG